MAVCRSFYILIFLVAIVHGKPKQFFERFLGNTNKCGYESCANLPKDKLNIHLVPHSHDDVGWLKTVDQYYYGSKTLIQKAGVQYILDSVVQELLKDPSRRFVYVESAFFFKWWDEQTPELQKAVKQLVNEGRLEFIGGAWSMNDEATTHYQSLIDQFAYGLKKLNNTFGECGRPRIGWQIDPFGHSREMASLFAQMGFDGLFFARLDYEDKNLRLKLQTAEMVWHASANLGKDADLFTGILYNHYSAPPGFCFDVLCSDEPIIDGKHSPDNNVNERIETFFNYAHKMEQYYKTNHLMMPMGDDFNFQDAQMYFKNLDKLIKYGNDRQLSGSDINIVYSTPSCYLKALHEADTRWPTKKEDFFPYSTDPHSFWAGYFSSRPTLKRFERIGNQFLQVCKQLSVFAETSDSSFRGNLDPLREAMGIMQHHDAITGTEKEKVAYDYAKILHESIEICSSSTKDALNKLINLNVKRNPTDLFEFESCLNLNISSCDISEQADSFIVTLYNPLSRDVSEYVRIPVKEGMYEVRNSEGNLLDEVDLLPIPSPVKNLPFRISLAQYELVFRTGNISPFGASSYIVTRKAEPSITLVRRNRDLGYKTGHQSDRTIGNSKFKLAFDSNGFLDSIEYKAISYPLRQEFLYYEGALGNNQEFSNRSSGAYIFRPNGTEHSITKKVQLEIVEGSGVQEVHQIFNEWVSQVIRIYEDTDYVEFEWLVGPIPIDDKKGKEIVTRFSTNIKSSATFYTDSNGREMIKRIRNKREAFKPNLEEFVSGNYYPVTTKIAIEDQNTRLAILTDRAQGGSSISDGQLELMVHRRLLNDDAFGVGEALNEMAFGRGLVARGKHYLLLGSTQSDIRVEERNLQLKVHLAPWQFFSTVKDANKDFIRDAIFFLRTPPSINILTLEPWEYNKVLLRLENILEKADMPPQSQLTRVNLKQMFSHLKVTKSRETTLDGNQWLSDNKRFVFKTDEDEDFTTTKIVPFDIEVDWNDITSLSEDLFDVYLQPMQIRTFVLEVEK